MDQTEVTEKRVNSYSDDRPNPNFFLSFSAWKILHHSSTNCHNIKCIQFISFVFNLITDSTCVYARTCGLNHTKITIETKKKLIPWPTTSRARNAIVCAKIQFVPTFCIIHWWTIFVLEPFTNVTGEFCYWIFVHVCNIRFVNV